MTATKPTPIGHGAGKYDDIATFAREKTNARGVVLLIVGGKLGQGFSVQATDPGFLMALPSLLREVADQVEADRANLLIEAAAKTGGGKA